MTPIAGEDEGSARTSVLATAEEAVARIEDGMTIAIGGLHTSSRPYSLIRALVRRGVKDLTVVGGAMASLDVDLLIGAGCVRRVAAGGVGAAPVTAIGPWFRRAAVDGSIEVWETDEGALYLALHAAAFGVPFIPWRAGMGTSIPDLNPDLKVIEDPFGSGPVLAVPAIAPDVALLHAATADEFGNVQPTGHGFSDDLLHRASQVTIVQVDRVVPNEVIRQRPERTNIATADVVVETPYGAHPAASPGAYVVDEPYLADYVAAVRADDDAWESWLQHEVLAHGAHADYLEHLGEQRLEGLRER
ncbi:MAG: hypothetical protein KY469_14510 [Actinobacteria bacterium]|nr:hypothetical protein [Actinomycetota bacterium]